MILLLSYDWYEQGTDPVIDWLLYYKAPFVKVTYQDLISKKNNCNINVNTGEIWVNGIEISQQIKVIWYRRFEDDLRLNLPDKFPTDQAAFEMKYEIRDLMKYLFVRFKDAIWLPTVKGIELNKLEVLYYGQNYKIKMPRTIVCNNKSDLINFYEECTTGIITKPIKHSGYFTKEDKTYTIYTNSLDDKFIQSLPDNFVTTLFQEKIKSKFEIRVFYLDGAFYATAIIIDKTNNQNVDVKLNFETNNINWIPFQLPKTYEKQLDAFFKSIDLNTCSFDVLLSEEGEYVLLELNPGGQYSAPSNRCNYNVEEKIAQWLIKQNEKE
jgi:hypothetical protein